jgi:hypothetical protein
MKGNIVLAFFNDTSDFTFLAAYDRIASENTEDITKFQKLYMKIKRFNALSVFFNQKTFLLLQLL